MIPPIESFIADYIELKGYLVSNSQISLSTTVDNHFRKVFLLSCASYYENVIQNSIKKFIDKKSSDERVLCFVTNKAINRQYHTYFNWDGNNINSFTGLFGSEFRDQISKEIRQNQDLEQNMKSFLNLTNERNKMVHENFLSYNLDKTFDEIVSLNKKAMEFVQYLDSQLK